MTICFPVQAILGSIDPKRLILHNGGHQTVNIVQEGTMSSNAPDPPSAGMSRRERFECLMGLSEFHLSRWRTKNATEWRVAFAAWAVLLASPIYVRSRPSDAWLAVILAFFFALYSYCWAFSIARKNHYDINMAFYYKTVAESLVFGRSIPSFAAPKQWDDLSKSQKRSFSRHVWRSAAFWFQIVTTAVISALVFVMVGGIGPVG